MSDTEPSKISSDRVALWEVPLQSGLYAGEFEHGTATGKRVRRMNGKVTVRNCNLYNGHFTNKSKNSI